MYTIMPLWIAYLSAALDEEAICHLHDVGFVNGVDALAAIVPRVLEGVLCYACAGVARDDLQHSQASEKGQAPSATYYIVPTLRPLCKTAKSFSAKPAEGL